MALLLFFLFSLPFHLLLPKADSQCPKSFDCGKFSFEFPFTNSSNPGCGLIMIHDCESESPKIHDYNIVEKISPNQFFVHDTQIQGFLNNEGCLLPGNLSMPQSYPISFTYSPNITLFTCFNQTPTFQIQEYFKNYRSFQNDRSRSGCQPNFSRLYYNISTDGLSETKEENSIPRECLMMQLPMSSGPDEDDLFSLLTPNFTLEWNVPEGCSPNINRNEYDCREGNTKVKKILFGGGLTIASLASTLIILFVFIRTKSAKAKQEHDSHIELFLKNNGNLAPMRYKYSTIKKMTKSFSETLGSGGFGSVYKGQLLDGHLVAVKVLNDSNGNGEDFMNEVASISRTSHINVVTLLGFCFEGSKRAALIYDFMPNGSLEKFIGSNTAESVLGWDKLFEIALGIARGLEYLHQGCNTRILHLDIKPQNILLDKDMNPRISDFGLAKLCPNRSSVVSMLVARGTIGYIAPEVFSRNFGEVSYKSDVYSYGMLVLEMVGGRRNIDRRDVDRTSEIYFPHYIYKQLEAGAERDGDLARTIDEDESQVVKRNLIIVGLWCIQTNPKDRPSMMKVVEMLEGKLGSLEVPPKPYLYSPPGSAPSFSISESV